MPGQLNEGEVVFNRVAVAQAKNQRLLQSLLGYIPADPKQEQEKDEEPFTPELELPGVGAAVPADLQDGIPKRSDLSSLDKLRKQLLGKDAVRQRPSQIKTQKPETISKPKFEPKVSAARFESEDEEEGRASAFKSRRPRKRKITKESDDDEETPVGSLVSPMDMRVNGATENTDPVPEGLSSATEQLPKKGKQGKKTGPSGSTEKSSNLLDELLSQKSKKKKKRKKNQDGAESPAA
ncbi:hypothetical protein K402DRAFT_393100 [Aulographum hederae CBS 113979]|uniref:Uncharacterized protein n=1 Tax=Aulographum hederae CBS 113979 TaxID=1176131 RepID=A0A6G1H149_9PEZI|nr:hypothetical protein K402DRAFT_393100 [Aulographum hederae CBS 113979]